MNRLGLRLLATAAALTAVACSKTPTPAVGSPTLALTANPSSIPSDGAVSTVVVTALDKDKKPASGTITLTVDKGDLGGKGKTNDVTLNGDGTAHVDFSCDVKKDPTCSGRAKVSAAWQGATADVSITLQGAGSSGSTSGSSGGSTGGTSGGSTGGGFDAGSPCDDPGIRLDVFGDPGSIGVAGSRNATSTNFVVLARNADGTNATGCSVTFAEQPGETLVTLSTNTSAVGDDGLASVTVTAGNAKGDAHVTATLGSKSVTQVIPVVAPDVPDAGGLAGATILWFATNPPPPLNTQGTGNNKTTVTFVVRYANNSPAPGVQVSFAEIVGESLVSLSTSSDFTNAAGEVSVDVTAGSVSDTAHIVASLPNGIDSVTYAIPIFAGAVDGGSTLAVSSIQPPFIVTLNNTGAGVSTSTQVTLLATDGFGQPLANQPVTMTEDVGESLVTISPATTTTTASGLATFMVTSAGNQFGSAHLNAVLAGGAASVRVVVRILGSPSQILFVSQSPSLLGIKGSGIQETGQMVFQVTDAVGNPIPSVQVDFTQTQPNLVTLTGANGGVASAPSDPSGNVTVTFSSGPEPGVTSILATVQGTNVSATHPLAVRGAKPSATHLYFQCDQLNLPVYDRTDRLSQTTCHVRLADRYNNRVGIPTPVSFASESGAITASVTTAPFDPASPDTEGTADVIFTTDFGAGGNPADVVPLANEPSVAPPTGFRYGVQEANPRDQLVTIIAMVQGEEGFFDSNRNNQPDPNELFIDLPAPFIDANDNNVADPARPNGPAERFFCATTAGGTCTTWQGPNGVWDATTTIWIPTWVVFTGASAATSIPATAWHLGSPDPTPLTLPNCSDGGIAAGESVELPIYAYDDFLNLPAPTTTFQVNTSPGPNVLTQPLLGSGALYDTYGSINFTYKTVAESDGGVCTTTNGTACVNAIDFGAFDNAFVGSFVFTSPPPPPPCTSPSVATATCTGFVTSVTAANSLGSAINQGQTLNLASSFTGGVQTITCQ